MSELLPCPFCGGEAEINGANKYGWSVWCKKCHSNNNWGHATEQGAIDAWNTRAGCKNCAALNRAAGLWAKADKRARDLERTCRNVDEDGDFECSECGFCWVFHPHYCPNCGRRVVSEYMLQGETQGGG